MSGAEQAERGAPGYANLRSFRGGCRLTSQRAGQVVNGTRGPFGIEFQQRRFRGQLRELQLQFLQTSLRHSGKRLDLMLAYTFSKSIDQASSISDVVNPFNYRATRALSAWDLTHNFVATYQYQLPFERFFGRARACAGWDHFRHHSRQFRFSGDDSRGRRQFLHGQHSQRRQQSQPRFAGLYAWRSELESDPRNGRHYFDTALFSPNALGTPGFGFAPLVLRSGDVELRSRALEETSG